MIDQSSPLEAEQLRTALDMFSATQWDGIYNQVIRSTPLKNAPFAIDEVTVREVDDKVDYFHVVVKVTNPECGLVDVREFEAPYLARQTQRDHRAQTAFVRVRGARVPLYFSFWYERAPGASLGVIAHALLEYSTSRSYYMLGIWSWAKSWFPLVHA